MVKTIEEMEGLIYLEDGTVFKGIGFGARGTAVGELVFNTSMTGYQKMCIRDRMWASTISIRSWLNCWDA